MCKENIKKLKSNNQIRTRKADVLVIIFFERDLAVNVSFSSRLREQKEKEKALLFIFLKIDLT